MTRQWSYLGYTIEAYPKGRHFKYCVWVAYDRVIAGTTLAEVFSALDALGGK